MKLSILLGNTFWLASLAACGATSRQAPTPPPAAAPTSVDAAPGSTGPAAADKAPTAGEMAPTPYTAAELRDATLPGRTYRYRVEAAHEPVRIQEIVFVTVTREGADIRQSTFDAEHKPVRDGGVKHVAWEELRRHAEFPRASVTVAEARVEVPAGSFDCKVYTVRTDDEVVRYSFAKTLPGAPVLIVAEKNGAHVLTQTLVEHVPGRR